MDAFARQLLEWFDVHGRHDLPWQQPRSPYRVWVSEIMLQQTQVSTVIPYFERFMDRFPTVAELAAAPLDDVLALWTGLGYYARARNLHAAAVRIVSEHDSELPRSVDSLTDLPGIGRSTAGAIVALAWGERAPILDGNVKRVLARYHSVPGYPGQSAVARRLWALAEAHTPHERVDDYTQAIMDLGATVCTRSTPACGECPLAAGCSARARDAVADFPSPRPKKDKPVRRSRFFLIHDGQGHCLLTRRPDSGVWGGLWAPPEASADGAIDETLDPLLATLGLVRADVTELHTGAPFRHTFTHFHLDIEPVYVRVSSPPGVQHEGDDRRWHRPDSGRPLGLPAPVVTLLNTITEFELT